MEHRLIHFAPGPDAAPKEKPVIQNPEGAQERLVGLSPDALKEIDAIVDKKGQEADKSEKDRQARYLGAVEKAAQAEYVYLTAQAAPAVSSDVALQKIRQAFSEAGIDVHLVVNDDGTLKAEAHPVRTTDRMTQEGIKDSALQKAIQDAVGNNPEAMNAVMHLAESLQEADHPVLQALMNDIKNLGSTAPYVFTDGIRILEKNNPATRDADVKALHLDAGAETKLKNFLVAIDGNGEKKPLLLRLGSSFKAVEAMQREQKSALSRKDISDIATRVGLDTFDADKAKPIDKEIMLARLRMSGIDVDEESQIFKRPPILKEFEGSDGEKTMNRFAGLISYVILNFQKLKDTVKPKEGKGKDTNAPAEAGPNLDGKQVSDIRKEMAKPGGKFGDDYITDKKTKLIAAQAALGLLAGDAARKEAEAKTDDTKKPALAAAKAALSTAEGDIQRIENQIDTAEKMLAESRQMAQQLDNKIRSMNNVTLADAKVSPLPGVAALRALLGTLSVKSYATGTVSMDIGGRAANFTQLKPLLDACSAEIGLKKPEAVYRYLVKNDAEGLTGWEIENPRDLLAALNKLEDAYQKKAS